MYVLFSNSSGWLFLVPPVVSRRLEHFKEDLAQFTTPGKELIRDDFGYMCLGFTFTFGVFVSETLHTDGPSLLSPFSSAMVPVLVAVFVVNSEVY